MIMIIYMIIMIIVFGVFCKTHFRHPLHSLVVVTYCQTVTLIVHIDTGMLRELGVKNLKSEYFENLLDKKFDPSDVAEVIIQ